ncbi:MAG: TRAP transporter substrate-binding protein DctP [Chloroflexota bacterium]
MKHKKAFTLTLAICLALVITTLPLVSGCGAPAEVVELDAVSALPENNIIGQVLTEYIARVNERAKGQLVINYKGGPEVIPGFEQPEALKNGVVDIILTIPAYYKKLMPSIAAMEIAPYDPPTDHNTGVYDFWVDQHAKTLNVRYLGKMTFGQQLYIWLNTPVDNLDGLSGKKLMATGSLNELAKDLGAVPTNIAKGEMHTSLERKIVDGWVTVSSSLGSYSAFDVITHYIDQPFYQTGTTLMCNLDSWNRVPKKMQNLMLDVAAEMEKEAMAEREQNDKEMFAKAAAAGIKPIALSAAESQRFLALADAAEWRQIEAALSPEDLAQLKKAFGK